MPEATTDEVRARQRRSAFALLWLLEYADMQDLPPILWTVHGEPGAGLTGHCTGPRELENLATWRAAIAGLIGPEHPDHGSGDRIFLYWRDFMGIALMLDAQPRREKPGPGQVSPDLAALYAKHADEIAAIEEIRRSPGQPRAASVASNGA